MTAWESSDRGERDAAQRVASAFWRYRWLLVVAAVAGALAGYLVSSLQTSVYAASARVILADRLGGDVLDTVRQSIRDPGRHVRNQAELMSSPTVAGVAAELLGGDVTPGQVASSTSAEPADGVDVVVIRARRADPAEAAAFADAVAEAYATVKTREAEAEAASATATLEELKLGIEADLREYESQLSDSPDDPSLLARRDSAVRELLSIGDQIDNITVNAALLGSGVELIEQAVVPRVPVSPRPLRSGLAAGGISLLLAMAWAWWRAVGKPVVVDSHDPAPIAKAPLLGEVPIAPVTEGAKLRQYPPGSAAGEAYSFVYGGLAPLLEEKPSLTVAVTSPSPQQGKTSTVLNLAAAGASAGVSALMVDADERARGLSIGLGEDETEGLTDLGSGNGSRLDDLLVTVDLGGEEQGSAVVSLLPAGSRLRGGSPAAFFRRANFRKAMNQIAGSAELVLVDTPPVLSVPEVSDIVREVDGVILVLVPGMQLALVEDARERLEMAGTPLIGYVVNRTRVRSDRYGYGYGPGAARGGGGLGQRLRSLVRRR